MFTYIVIWQFQNVVDQVTLFAPTDAAFRQLGAISTEELIEILQYHAIPGQTLWTAEITKGQILQSYDNKLPIRMSRAGTNQDGMAVCFFFMRV